MWISAGIALLFPLGLAGWICWRARFAERIVALQFAGTVSALLITVLSTEFGRSTYLDVALASAVISYSTALVFARALERWF